MSDGPSVAPLSTAAPWDLVAAHYATDVLPMFEQFSRRALELAGVVAGQSIVDVACGPGTLARLAADLGADVAAIDFSAAMIAELHRAASPAQAARITATVGDGTALAWPNAGFDAGFSMFGLMFFPDRARGFAELARVLRPHALCVVSSWKSLDRVPVLAAAYDALEELLPGPKPPQRAMPLVDVATCREEMTAGGFRDVEVVEFAGSADVSSTSAFVAQMERTNAPIALAKQRLGDAWPAIAEQLRERVVARVGDGPQTITMPANLIIGRR